jgi:hypothetical protein
MDVLSIQGLMGKLQLDKEKVNEIQEDVGAQAFFFFQSKMVLDIPNGLENVDKAKEEEVVTTSIGQSVDRIKQIGRPVTLIVAI